MTATTDSGATPADHPGPGLDAGAGADAAETGAADGGPGRLTIADRVVEKIAAQAAGEVDNATGAPHRVLGVNVSDDPRTPQVSARVDGHVATVTIHLAVTWPAPVLDVTRQVRQRVTTRLGELAGINRAQIDIDVAALSAPIVQERRVH